MPEGKGEIGLSMGEGKEEQRKGIAKGRCSECIYLVQTRHFLSRKVLGYHCFNIGRQQYQPDHYNFSAAEIKREIPCDWFESIDSLGSPTGPLDGGAPRIQRFVTIKVWWEYDWEKAEGPEQEEA